MVLDEGGRAYIPATTIAGAFRGYLKSVEGEASDLFGAGGENSSQSSVYVKDSYAKTRGIERRDGVRIDKRTGSAEKESKVDRIYLKKGLEFSLEFKIEDKTSEIEIKKEKLYRCLRALDSSFIRFGGNKSNGLGIFKVKQIQVLDFDFNNRKEWIDYIKKDYSKALDMTDKILVEEEKNNKFIEFNLKGNLTTPLLIGACESYDSDKVDKSSMKSGEEYIIAGSSFKGIIRSRIETISNYFNNSKIAREIFGDQKLSGKDKTNVLSHIFVNESVIDNSGFEMKKYNRIKIDMFTGGVRKSALMDEEPVQGSIDFKLIYRLKDDKAKDNYAIGVIMLALRDLATENLSLGSGYSIGRGMYRGDSLTMSSENGDIVIDFNKKSISDEAKINKYISSVKTFKEGGQDESAI